MLASARKPGTRPVPAWGLAVEPGAFLLLPPAACEGFAEALNPDWLGLGTALAVEVGGGSGAAAAVDAVCAGLGLAATAVDPTTAAALLCCCGWPLELAALPGPLLEPAQWIAMV